MKISIEQWKRLRQDVCEENFLPIYENTRALVYTICIRILRSNEDASDAFQATYARVLALARNPEEADKITDPDDTVRILAVREASNLLKRRHRRSGKEIAMEDLSYFPDGGKTPGKQFEQKEKTAIVQGLVNQLPEKYRIPVILHYFQGMTHKEIARALGRSRPAITLRLSRALKKLEPMFRKAGLKEATMVLGGLAGTLELLDPPASLASSLVFPRALEAANTMGAVAASSPPALSPIENLFTGAMKHKLVIAVAGALSLGIVAGVISVAKKHSSKYEQTRIVRSEKSHSSFLEKDRALSETREIAKSPARETTQKDKRSLTAAAVSKLEKNHAVSEESQSGGSTFQGDLPATGPVLILSGRITLDDGSPAPRTRLQLTRMKSGMEGMEYIPVAETLSDREGGYLIRTSDAQLFRIRAARKGSATTCSYIQDPNAFRYVKRKERIRRVARDIQLPPAAFIRGVVIDEDKNPVPRITVHAFCLDEEMAKERESMVETQAVTDKNGFFAVEDITSGEAFLSVDAPEFTPLSQSVVAPVENVEIRLSRKGASLEGRIYMHSTGEAIPGMKVVASPVRKGARYRSISFREALTDETGSFLIDKLIDASYHVHPSGKGLFPVPKEGEKAYIIPLQKNEKKTGIDIFMYEGHTIHGTVVDGKSKESLEGVRVSIPDFLDPGKFAYITDTDGRFEFSRVPPTAGLIQVDKKGYSLVTDDSHRNYIPLNLSLSNLEISKEIEMLGRVSISGRVLDSDGEPVPGAGVALYTSSNILRHDDPLPVDENGAFTLDATPFTPCRVRAKAPGFPPSLSSLIQLQDEPVSDVEIILKSGVEVSGIVLDDQGKAIQGALVNATKFYSLVYIHTEKLANMATDAAGRFRLTDLPLDKITLTAEKGGFAPSREYKVDLTSGKGVENLEITLRSSSFLGGTVTDPDGNPLEGVHVWANRRYSSENSSGSDQTDDQGRFRIEGLVNRPHKVSLHHPEYGSEHYEEIEVNRDNAVFVMGTKANVTLLGYVVDSATGEPVEDFSISGLTAEKFITRSPDRPGRFRAEKLQGGISYRFTITSPLYCDLVQNIEAPKDTDTIERTFRMTAGGTITGRAIHKQTREPLSGVRINLLGVWKYAVPGNDKSPKASFVTGIDGRFSFRYASVGKNHLEFIPPSPLGGQEREIDVKSGETSDMGDVEIGEGATIEGRLLFMPGERPLAGKRIDLKLFPQDNRHVITDQEGRFSFTGLKNEHHSLIASEYGIEHWVSLKPDEKKEVRILVGTGSLKGRILKDGEACFGRIRLHQENWIEASAGEGGKFVIRNLAPGNWKVRIFHQGREAGQDEFTLSPGEEKTLDFEIPD